MTSTQNLDSKKSDTFGNHSPVRKTQCIKFTSNPHKVRKHYLHPVRNGGTTRTNNQHGRLLVSNIGSNIGVKQIFDKFSEIGPVGRVILHYDKEAKEIGTGEVWMSCGADAIKAKKLINGHILFNDGTNKQLKQSSK